METKVTIKGSPVSNRTLDPRIGLFVDGDGDVWVFDRYGECKGFFNNRNGKFHSRLDITSTVVLEPFVGTITSTRV